MPPPKKNSYGEVLNPVTSTCDLIWKEGLCRGNHVRIKFLKWALIKSDYCLYTKREFGHRQVSREDDERHRETAAIHPQAEERDGTDPSLTALRGTDSASTLLWDFWPPALGDN